jgi:putative SOS response-associated peptidase YedK
VISAFGHAYPHHFSPSTQSNEAQTRIVPHPSIIGLRDRGQERRLRSADELFGFLTTEANAIVAPIHPKAMPVILTTPAEVDLWFAADAPKALELQRPLPEDALRIVASGEKEDGAPVLI